MTDQQPLQQPIQTPQQPPAQPAPVAVPVAVPVAAAPTTPEKPAVVFLDCNATSGEWQQKLRFGLPHETKADLNDLKDIAMLPYTSGPQLQVKFKTLKSISPRGNPNLTAEFNLIYAKDRRGAHRQGTIPADRSERGVSVISLVDESQGDPEYYHWKVESWCINAQKRRPTTTPIPPENSSVTVPFGTPVPPSSKARGSQRGRNVPSNRGGAMFIRIYVDGQALCDSNWFRCEKGPQKKADDSTPKGSRKRGDVVTPQMGADFQQNADYYARGGLMRTTPMRVGGQQQGGPMVISTGPFLGGSPSGPNQAFPGGSGAPAYAGTQLMLTVPGGPGGASSSSSVSVALNPMTAARVASAANAATVFPAMQAVRAAGATSLNGSSLDFSQSGSPAPAPGSAPAVSPAAAAAAAVAASAAAGATAAGAGLPGMPGMPGSNPLMGFQKTIGLQPGMSMSMSLPAPPTTPQQQQQQQQQQPGAAPVPVPMQQQQQLSGSAPSASTQSSVPPPLPQLPMPLPSLGAMPGGSSSAAAAAAVIAAAAAADASRKRQREDGSAPPMPMPSASPSMPSLPGLVGGISMPAPLPPRGVSDDNPKTKMPRLGGYPEHDAQLQHQHQQQQHHQLQHQHQHQLQHQLQHQHPHAHAHPQADSFTQMPAPSPFAQPPFSAGMPPNPNTR